MKVKLPVTEQFLWDVYTLLEDLGRVGEIFGPRSFREVTCPDIRSLRYEARRRYQRRNFAQLVYRLKRNGFIKTPDWDPKAGIVITPKGLEKVLQIALKVKKKQRRSDGRYIMVVFDIPEQKRKARNEFRTYIKFLGYVQFQQSIWISPFEVLAETQNIIRRFNMEDEAKIFIVESPY